MSRRKKKEVEVEPFQPDGLQVDDTEALSGFGAVQFSDKSTRKDKKKQKAQAQVRPPVTQHPDTEPRLTVEQYAKDKGNAGIGFQRVERYHHGVRKLTKAQWDAEFDQFINATRR